MAGNIVMDVVLSKKGILVKGISTHNKAQSILYDLRDYIEVPGRSINVTFTGSPGPLGEGICLEIDVNGILLDKTTIMVLKKFFELRGGKVIVKEV
ncbi:MAG: hypothetical protein J7K21_06810 [Desulfurococcales archaeon]|nr:hypothetical protein [Desulfurococcales archaeon]